MHPTDARWKVAASQPLALEMADPDPGVVLQEHDTIPKSYMAVSNLKAICRNAREILALLNEQDELPAWTEEMLSVAKTNTEKALSYIRGEKS